MLLISCHIIIHFRCQTYIKTYISIVVQESEWGVGWNPFVFSLSCNILKIFLPLIDSLLCRL